MHLKDQSVASSAGQIDDAVLAAIAKARIVPVLRTATPDACVQLGKALLSSGLELIEVAATTPGWQQVVERLRGLEPTVTLGVGTILDADMAQTAVSLGADFLVSPHPNPALALCFPAQLIEGGFSPAEINASASRGLVKLFPAHVGGKRHLESLLAVYPTANIMPTGGLTLAEAPVYLAAGAFAVGVGSGLAHLADPARAIAEAIHEAQCGA